jgi:WD40 repeat protein
MDLKELDAGIGQIWSVAVDPKGKRLAAAGDDGTVALWDLRKPLQSEPALRLRGHSGSVWAVAFGANGSLLASASDDNSILLWDVETGSAIGEPLIAHTGQVNALSFSPVTQQMASAGDDGKVVVWDLSVDRWRETACRVAGRNLTREEWRRYTSPEDRYKRLCPAFPTEELEDGNGLEKKRRHH